MIKKRNLLILSFLFFCMSCYFSVSPIELADDDSRFVNLMGIELHYKIEGNADRLMLMFHGFGSSTFTWNYIKDDFSSEFTLLAYDRPAFGLTERILDVDEKPINHYYFYNQSMLANELIKTMSFKPGEIFLMGHSAGTPVAIDYYRQYPSNIKGLILISPALEHKLDDNPFAKTFSNPLIRGTVSLFKNLLARTLEGGLDESWYDTTKITEEIRSEYKKFTTINDWEKALIEFTLNQGDFDMLPELTQIDIPVLLIYGKEDKIVPYDEVLDSIKDNRNITVVALEKTGHVPHEETPDLVINTIREWMAKTALK